jgi:hypothetical protein
VRNPELTFTTEPMEKNDGEMGRWGDAGIGGIGKRGRKTPKRKDHEKKEGEIRG